MSMLLVWRGYTYEPHVIKYSFSIDRLGLYYSKPVTFKWTVNIRFSFCIMYLGNLLMYVFRSRNFWLALVYVSGDVGV